MNDRHSDRHNDRQRRYFTGRRLPRMEPELATTPYVQRQVDELLRSAEARPGHKIIDLGCGLGKYTAALKARGYEVEGLDLTPELVEDLRSRRVDFPVHIADAASPPRELEGRFDLAVGFFFLHHVGDLASILAGIGRVLRPGGRAAFLEPNPLFLGYYLQILLTPGIRWRHERGLLRMRPRGIELAARANGFRSLGHRSFGALPPLLANRAWGPALERALESLPGWRHVGAFQLFVLK